MLDRLNWQPDLPDFRDYPFVGVTAVDALPVSVDLRTTGYLNTGRAPTDTPVLELFRFVIAKETTLSLDPKLRVGFGASMRNDFIPTTRSDIKALVKKGIKISDGKLSYFRLSIDLNTIKQCLADGYPFIFGFTAYDSFETNTSPGEITIPTEKENVTGSFVMLAVGYDDETSIVTIKGYNRFGDNGFFYMPYNYITNTGLCGDFWTVRKTQ